MLEQDDLKKLLEDIIKAEALELIRCPEKNENDLFIPYMMNDAVEYYLVLTDCHVYGEKRTDFPIDTVVEIAQKEERQGIILRMPEQDFVTIWYKEVYEVKKFYQYHGIGHFWRKGQEQWRCLVYSIGTAYDKLEFLGEESCNEIEKELIPLMNFGPFRYWSPIHEDLADRYSDHQDGIRIMGKYAKQVADKNFCNWLRIYKLLYRIPFVSRKKVEAFFAKKMLAPERVNLYWLILQRFEMASKQYEKREYATKQLEEMDKKRNEIRAKLIGDGYTGMYPVFHKGRKCIVAMEEHPFTIQSMDYEDFHFRIQFMVSESEREIPNAGFFEGNGTVIEKINLVDEII